MKINMIKARRFRNHLESLYHQGLELVSGLEGNDDALESAELQKQAEEYFLQALTNLEKEAVSLFEEE